MNAGGPEAPPSPLIFDWPKRKQFSFVFMGCVAASIVAHAATFFLFQVVYPQHVTIPQTAPRVSLLTPSTPENIALLHWIEAEDPALAAGGVVTHPPGLGDVRYQPSYAVPHTAPLGVAPERPEPVRFPAARDPLSLITGASAETARPPSTSPPHATSLTFSGPLASRFRKSDAALSFSNPSPIALQPSQWLIGVSDRGEVCYIFLQESCGDPTFDDLASDHLRQLSFAGDVSPITWGFALVSWGDDAYKKADPKSAPRQPSPP